MSSYDDCILEFELKSGFTIERLAPKIVALMQYSDMDAYLYLSGTVTFEIDRECTVEDIINGYKQFIQDKISKTSISNKTVLETV